MKNQKIRRACALMLVVPLSLTTALWAQDAPLTRASPPAGALIPGRTFATGDTFRWKFQPPLGLRGRYTMYSRFKMAQNSPARPAVNGRPAIPERRFDLDTHNTTEIDYEVVSRDTKGGTTSRLTYRSMKSSSTQRMDGKPIEMPKDATQDKRVQEMLNGLVLQIKQGPDGRVWNIVGLDAMQRRLRNSLGEHAAVAAMMEPLFDSMLNEKTLRQTWDTAANRPQNPITVGDSWNYSLPFDATVMNMDMRGTRTLTALDSDRAFIADRANLSMKLDVPLGATAAMPAPPQVQSSGDGVMTGNSIVNRTTGMEIETHTTERLTMKTKVQTMEAGRVVDVEFPQWLLMQTHNIFRPSN